VPYSQFRLLFTTDKISVQLEGYDMTFLTVQQNDTVLNVVFNYCTEFGVKCKSDIEAYFDGEAVALTEKVLNLKARMKQNDILCLYQFKEPKVPTLPSAPSS